MTSALHVSLINFGFRLIVFFTAINTPPPLSLNLRWFVGSGGLEDTLRSTQKILYILEGKISSSLIAGLNQVSFSITMSGDVSKI